MNFCMNCGLKLVSLKAPSWTSRYRCDGCGKRYQLSHGDDMGGGAGSFIQVRESPFGEEEPQLPPVTHDEPYEAWLARVAEARGSTPKEIEDRYGDMPRDMFDLGDSIGDAIENLIADDAEWQT